MSEKIDNLRLSLLCGVYALFYTFCLYKNYSGVTFPFFAVGTLCFFGYFMRRQGLTMKRFSAFLIAGIMIFSVNICLTGSMVLIGFDRAFIFVLFFILILHNLYDDKTWDTSRYFTAILSTVASSIQFLPRPIQDIIKRLKSHRQEEEGEKKGPGTVFYIFAGLAISLPILLIVVPLLASSDAVFSNMLIKMLDFEFDEDIAGVAFMMIAVFFIAYAFIIRFNIRISRLDQEVTDKRRFNPVVATTISAVMFIVYGLYCMIQIVYLFMGYGTLPQGYTYAEYVHEGFYQLVFVCIINLVLVLLCRKYSRDNTVLKIMLSLISLCTFIMIFSSAYRMVLYVDAYGLTFLRLYVMWALVVIGLAMTGTLVYIFVSGMPFCKYCIVVLTCMWVAFILIRPDYIIAKYNLLSQENCDTYYITHNLSSDAAPAVEHYADDDVKEEYLKRIYSDQKVCNMNLRTFNYSRWIAAGLVSKESGNLSP